MRVVYRIDADLSILGAVRDGVDDGPLALDDPVANAVVPVAMSGADTVARGRVEVTLRGSVAGMARAGRACRRNGDEETGQNQSGETHG
jgi:hypothetical protein